MKQQLQADVKAYFKDKWENVATDQLTQILELRPDNSFGYLFEKNILKQKPQTPLASLLIDLSLYLTSKQFQDRLFSICIQKHNQTRLRKPDFKKLLEIICLELQPSQKDILIQTIVNLQNDRIPISKLSLSLHLVSLYCRAVNQLKTLIDSIEQAGEHLTISLLAAYMKAEPNSYISKFTFQSKTQKIKIQGILSEFIDNIKRTIVES